MSRRTRSSFLRLALALVPLIALSLQSAGPQLAAAPSTGGVKLSEALFGLHVGHPEPREDIKARDEWFYAPRTAPGRKIPVGALAEAREQADAIEASRTSTGKVGAARTSASTSAAAWTNLGPKPADSADFRFNDPAGGTPILGWHNVTGRVSDIKVHPREPQIVYSGAAGGGVWRSTNAGGTWRPLTDRLPSLAIGAMQVDPSRPDWLYVGTGEEGTSSDAYWGMGLFRSKDRGNSFTKLGGPVFNQHTIFEIVVQSTGNRLFVATNKGLYRSLDAGQTWKRILAPGGSDALGNFVTYVTPLPGSPTALLAGVGWRGGNPKNGLYQSNNLGDTWSRIDPAGFTPQPRIGRMSFAVHAETPGLIYAVVQDAVLFNTGGATVLNGVYKTTSGPSGPWTLVATSETYANDPNSALNPLKIGPGYQPGIQSWYNQYVEINPLDADHVIVGLEEIYDTEDGGLNWDTIGRYWNFCITDAPPNCNLNPNTHPTTHPDQHAATFTEVNGEAKVFVGNDGGVWSQTGPPFDNDHWSNHNTNMSTIQFYYTEPSGGPDYVVYGGTQDNGHIKYEGNPTWPIVYGGDGGDAAVEPNNPNNAYEEYVYLTMAKTRNGGRTWENIYTPDSGNPATARFISPFEMDPLSKNHIVALGQHVWETNIGINTESDDWQEAYDFGPGHLGTALDLRGPTIYAGWCGPCNPANPVDPSGAGFARGLATNAGGTWHAVPANGLPNRFITGIAIDPNNPNHVFVTLSGFSRRWVAYAGNGSIFESTNGGRSFSNITKNLPDAPANDALLYQGRLIVATDVGVFERAANGSWGVLGSGLPKVSVLDLALVPGQPTLIAGSHGRGAWALQL